MKRLKIYALPIVLLILVASCKRDLFNTHDDAEGNNKSAVNIAAKDLMVPASFSFSSEKTLNVRVKVAGAKATERHVIKIYADVPSTGKLISTGLTNASAEYATTIKVPAWEDYIYIEKINPDGSSQFEKVQANQFASAIFSGGANTNPYIFTKKSSGMDCSTGCTVTYNNPSSNITVTNGQIACITGTVSGSITLTVNKGGTAKICASGEFDQINVDDSASVYILENTIIKINGVILVGLDSDFKNWSDSLYFNQSDIIFLGGHGYNYGKMQPYYTFHIYDGGSFTNNGDINFVSAGSGFMLATDSSTITNNGTIKNVSSFSIFDFSMVTNNCYIDAQYVSNGSILINNSYIKATEEFTQAPFNLVYPPYTELNNAALISTKDLIFTAGEIKGTGSSRSKIKVSANTNFGTDAGLKGILDLCDNNGIETNSGIIYSPALANCVGYIATSTCNPEGFGSFVTQDTDNDGVADSQDEYPNDGTRAFNSYYPNATTNATLAFEDMWPALADYDFNDLVVAFNIRQVLNANNEVVEVKVNMKIKAVGGSYVNGLGFQLDDVAPGDVANITGQVLSQNFITRSANNTEAGQSKAVIICYDSPEPLLHREYGSMFNTIKTNPRGHSDTMIIGITFTNPVAGTKLSIDKFNPFMIINKQRGYEVHLGNFKPTDLANTGVFGSYSDRTNPGNNIYYKNDRGLPWAILVPDEFVYPTEKTAITSGYNIFDDWAISSGANYSNWYTNAPGNRNTNNLY
jgi:LruC domain-containing protein